MSETERETILQWRELPPLPQSLAGQFVGVLNGKLIVAGGTHWTAAPWAGGEKIWADRIYALDDESSPWREAGHLPIPLAYGAALTTATGIILIGGQTENSATRAVYRASLNEAGAIEIENLPDLPHSLMMHAAAISGKTIYVGGGQTSPTVSCAENAFWSFELAADGSDGQSEWRKLTPLPEAARILPIAVGTANGFYVFGGAELVQSKGGATGRRYLTDAYHYHSDTGNWQRLTEMPFPRVAGLGFTADDSDIFLFGGDDGKNAADIWRLKDEHPGFRREVLKYDSQIGDFSIQANEMPISLVTTGLVRWKEKIVIAGGEDRPGHRSARVLAAQIEANGRIV